MEFDDDKTRLPGNLGVTADGSVDRFASASTHVLPMGTRLGEFEVVDLIGEGGFGIVYLAFDHSLERHVAVKEYMPSGLVARNRDMQVTVTSPAHKETFNTGLRSFINEARLLARFDSPALVKVFRFWEGNGTAYMAMPFYEGVTVKQAFSTGRIIPDEQWIKAFLTHLFDAVETIHAAQCYHRDIAPDNILLLRDGRPLLLDFGAARRVISDRTQGPTAILKPGFAPIEQYADIPNLKQGPWTDVYAIGALVYYLITGKPPAPAVSRIMHDDVVPAVTVGKGRYTAAFLSGLDNAMAVRPEQRLQNVAELRRALDIYQDLPRTMPPTRINAATDAAKEAAPDRSADVAAMLDGGNSHGQPAPRTLLREPETEPPLTLQRTWTTRLGKRRKAAWGAGLAFLVLGIAAGGALLRHDKGRNAAGADQAGQSPAGRLAPDLAGNGGGSAGAFPSPPDTAPPQRKGERADPVIARTPDRPAADASSVPAQAPAPAAASVPATAPVLAAPPSDQVMWEMVSGLNNAEGYAAYLRQFPKGRYAATAKTRTVQLAANADPARPSLATGTTPTPPASPADKPSPTLEATVAEEDLWRTVRNIDQALAYESFLSKFPNSVHASATRGRIAELGRQPAPKQTVASKPSTVPVPVPVPAAPDPNRPAEANGSAAGGNDSQVARNDGKAPLSGPVTPSRQTGQAAPAPQPRSDPEPVTSAGTTIRLANQTLIGDFLIDPVTGQVSGRGKVLFNNRDQFTGTLVRGSREGNGEFIWASGQRYKGEWQQNQPNGKGYMKFPNGNEYTGDMKNGVPDGMGTIVFSNGHRYTGSVRNGLPDGNGTHRYSTGDVHTGSWSKGKSNGFGRYTWASGDYWEGEFRDDKQTENGKTVYVGSSGNKGNQAAVTETPRKSDIDSLSQQSGSSDKERSGN